MVMTAPILSAALAKAKAAVDPNMPVIAVTPQGQKLDAKLAQKLAEKPGLIVVAGRY